MKKNANSKAAKPAKAKKAKTETQNADSLLAVTKQDSTNVLAVQPDSVANDASNELQLPTPEQLGISISTGFSGDTLKVTKGDTIDFPITVSWSANGSAILVVPTGSATTKDIAQVGLSQESSRIVKDGKELAQITFNYKLVIQDEGNLVIPAMRFEIPTPMGQSLSMRSEPVQVLSKAHTGSLTIIVAIVVALVVVLSGVLRMRRRAKAKKVLEKWKDALAAIREHMLVLKQRVNVADSREWLLELEGVCKEFMALRFGVKDASTINLDNLVKAGSLEGWEHIVEEFAHARYGGGIRDSFENKETWKLAMTLMELEEEE
jgi:hypothetical protein